MVPTIFGCNVEAESSFIIRDCDESIRSNFSPPRHPGNADRDGARKKLSERVHPSSQQVVQRAYTVQIGLNAVRMAKPNREDAVAVAVPIRSFSGGKERLSSTLSVGKRSALARKNVRQLAESSSVIPRRRRDQ